MLAPGFTGGLTIDELSRIFVPQFLICKTVTIKNLPFAELWWIKDNDVKCLKNPRAHTKHLITTVLFFVLLLLIPLLPLHTMKFKALKT